MFAYQPSLPKIFLAGAFILVSLAVRPGWLPDWLAGIKPGATFHQAPALLKPGGFLLLLSGLRWRDPRGRLLAMSLLPQSMWFYDLYIFWLLYMPALFLVLLPERGFNSLIEWRDNPWLNKARTWYAHYVLKRKI